MQSAPPHAPNGAGSATDDGGQVDVLAQLSRLMQILRRRWLVIAVTTVVCIAGSIGVLRLLEPRWQSSASIVLHMSGPQVLDKVEGVGEDAQARLLGYKEYYQTQRQIMSSRTVAAAALESLGLAADPQFLGVHKIEDPAEREAEAAEVDPVERLREMLTITEVPSSRIVLITAEYPDPLVARNMANAVAEAYIDHTTEGRKRVGLEAEEDLSEERDKARGSMQEAERLLEAFKNENRVTSLELNGRDSDISTALLKATDQHKEAQSERDRLSQQFKQAKDLYKKDPLAAAYLLPEDKRDVFEEMRKQQLAAETLFNEVDVDYGPKHEQHRKAKQNLDLINGKIARETKSLLASLERQVEAATRHESFQAGVLATARRKALALSSLEREYVELKREASVASEEYLLVARRDTEIELTNRVENEGIEILDRATVSAEAVFPPKELIVLLGGVLGMGLGCVLALSIDFRDSRLRGLLDLERSLSPFGVPVLGQLPLLPPDSRLGAGNARAQRKQRDLYAHKFPQSLMAERCRGIRTSLAFVQGGEPASTIMITSPSSSEGKSSTAMNLALSFCQAGKSVLVIDADMRRPRLHQVFETDPKRTGLSALLAGEAEIDDAVITQPDGAPESLSIMVCGEIPDDPAEKLESHALHQLLIGLKERFDVVILDSPPVLPVADPLILASQVDGVIVVSRCEQTRRGELQRAMSSLMQSDANMLGVVLNEVDARQERYDYGGGSGYYTYKPRETGTDA
ncbi:MAG: GumC family protein [Nannocystales bacterium]